jgi:zinc/manganese transport system permease protein
VHIAGVLLVFCYLIVPAALAGLFAENVRPRLFVAWAFGVALTAAGLYASWAWDLPTGPAIVAAFGGATALVAIGFASRKRGFAKALAALVCLAGVLLVTFPAADQPWIDALGLQALFLSESERETRRETVEAVEQASAELAELRKLEQDVRWGAKMLEAEKAERLRQYLAARSEILAGDRLVLRDLNDKARRRSRYALGIPLVLLGAAGLVWLARRRT